jgi:hypothetical protein
MMVSFYILPVGLEGGCELQGSFTIPSATLSSAADTDKELACFAWMCVLHSPHQNPSMDAGAAANKVKHSFSRTASFPLPPVIASLVLQGTELGVADDIVFNRTDSKRSNGSVGLLSRDVVTRTEYYRHALMLALIPFVNPTLYQ